MELWGAALYGDPCHECEFDWSLSPIDAIAFIEELPDRLAEATAGATGEERGPAGGWSVKEYVSHVGDNLRAWAERVQGARLAGDQAIAGYDPDSLANARNYATIPLPAALWSAGISAREWAPVLQQALVERVELHHATRGVQRAEDIARNNCHDAYHHLWDIRRLRALSNPR